MQRKLVKHKHLHFLVRRFHGTLDTQYILYISIRVDANIKR